MAITKKQRPAGTDAEAEAVPEPLIPGLPNDIAEQCLIHLPFPYHSASRSVSSSWNHVLTGEAFQRLKSASPRSQYPTVFVFSVNRISNQKHFHSLDTSSGRWFLLPSPPLPHSPSSFATATLHNNIYILGGEDPDTKTPSPSVFRFSPTNSWSPATPMPSPRSFFAAATVSGRIMLADGNANYDPVAERWNPGMDIGCRLARYEVAVMGSKMYVTEGWTWPFTYLPIGRVYDGVSGKWEEMKAGLLDGWTGVVGVAAGGIFSVAEYGDRRLKVFEEGKDEWVVVGGRGVPEEVKRPFTVVGAEDGRMYVVGSGLNVAIGKVVGEGDERWRVEWEVVKGPPGMDDLAPSKAHVLYV